MRFPSPVGILLLMIVALPAAPAAEADWHVILLATCATDDAAATAALQRDAERLNGLHEAGYPRIRPYFSVVTTTGGRSGLVFGLRDEVRGLRKADFPNMLDGLRTYEHDGRRPFADAVWIAWRDLRPLLVEPP